MDKNSINKHSLIFFSASFLANFLNFIFNIYVGRRVSLEEFGVITLITSFWYILGIPYTALLFTITNSLGELNRTTESVSQLQYLRRVTRSSSTIVLLVTLVWLILAEPISHFFRLTNSLPIITFAPVFYLGLILAINRGVLQGQLQITKYSISILSESIAKLLLAIILINLISINSVHLVVIGSVLIAYLITYYIERDVLIDIKIPQKASAPAFPYKFFLASMINGAAITIILAIDLLIVKHYLSEKAAGEYALLSLSGKLVYFVGTLLNGLMLAYLSRQKNLKSKTKIFNTFALISGLVIFLAFLIFGVFGFLTVPLLFGNNAIGIINYLLGYTLAISLLTFAQVIVVYQISLRHFYYAWLMILSAILIVGGVVLFHQDLNQIVNVIETCSSLIFLMIVVLHFCQTRQS